MEPDSVFLGERVMGVEVDSAIEHLDELARSRGYNVVNLPLLDRSAAILILKTKEDKVLYVNKRTSV
jgi:hypothetical protein